MKHSLLSLLALGMLSFGACSSSDTELFPEESTSTETKATGVFAIRMDAPYNIKANSYDATGYLDSDDYSTVKEYGFLYTFTNEEPALRQSGTYRKRFTTGAAETFSSNITGLAAAKTYYTRAYAVNQTDTVYSPIFTFFTEVESPEIETLQIYTRTKRSAIVGGRFTKAGEQLKSYGVCISRDPLPSLTNSTFVAAQDTAKDAMMRGEFGVFFDDLEPNTMYHVRAYAINSKDTV